MLRIDWVEPLSVHSTLELGLKGETRLVSNNFKAESSRDARWQILANMANTLDYHEKMGSAYAQFNSKILQDPCVNKPTDTPVTAIARTIERNSKTNGKRPASAGKTYRYQLLCAVNPLRQYAGRKIPAVTRPASKPLRIIHETDPTSLPSYLQKIIYR